MPCVSGLLRRNALRLYGFCLPVARHFRDAMHCVFTGFVSLWPGISETQCIASLRVLSPCGPAFQRRNALRLYGFCFPAARHFRDAMHCVFTGFVSLRPGISETQCIASLRVLFFGQGSVGVFNHDDAVIHNHTNGQGYSR